MCENMQEINKRIVIYSLIQSQEYKILKAKWNPRRHKTSVELEWFDK